MLSLVALIALTDSLEGRIAQVMPTPQENAFLEIPWRTNLDQARIDAQRESKPVFMYIMNGHPLGCT